MEHIQMLNRNHRIHNYSAVNLHHFLLTAAVVAALITIAPRYGKAASKLEFEGSLETKTNSPVGKKYSIPIVFRDRNLGIENVEPIKYCDEPTISIKSSVIEDAFKQLGQSVMVSYSRPTQILVVTNPRKSTSKDVTFYRYMAQLGPCYTRNAKQFCEVTISANVISAPVEHGKIIMKMSRESDDDVSQSVFSKSKSMLSEVTAWCNSSSKVIDILKW
ncbi:hypothetical protein [Rhizobium ruizarguesonis]|uniref:hypothetical protein n=1 Tax=Rhizobium ruizarguesonis TaxID=2081791 RepID=UPI001030F45D|nr:hypothetical protein [Rhizobium ruizarguesonis]TAT71064.1 hypothetical protein ELI52_36480 [Rhizobium ruizarguesonis]